MAADMDKKETPACEAEVSEQIEGLGSFYSSEIGRKQFPLGLLGDVAWYIYCTSPRPLYETALVGALGFMAGICGRAFNFGGSGLNLYLIMIADTGRGKEAISKGISLLTAYISPTCPAIRDYEGPSYIASSQGLSKWLSRNSCVYSVVGEFGIKLRQMADEKAAPHLAMLKADLLALFHKSGRGDTWGASAYANSENNIAPVRSPSFTLIGESTPIRFYENINEDVVTDGLLPRFTIFTYEGDQGELNEHRGETRPSDSLIQQLGSLVAQASSISARNEVQTVDVSHQAREQLRNYEQHCRRCVNNCDPITGLKHSTKAVGVVTELWNRAHIKASRLAALAAVGCNPYHPCVDDQQATWAINLISAQTFALLARFASGEVGDERDNETLRRSIVVKIIFHYRSSAFDDLPKYGAVGSLHEAGIITQSYILKCINNKAPFRKAPGGATAALRVVIKNLLDGDELRELSHADRKRFGTTARAYVLSQPLAFIAPGENYPYQPVPLATPKKEYF
jgi:hypothetical protein